VRAVEYLTTFDAGFLGAEDSDERISLAIGGLAVLEGPIPDREALRATLAERIGSCPRFAQRLRRRPFDLGAPEWVDDIDFNLAHHVRRIALPRPGDDAELYQLVADVMARRLDRSRPLWEIWVIEGLADGRWAMLMKVHHCIADGIATAHMLAGLSDGGIRDSFTSRIRAAAEPTGEPRNTLTPLGFGANPVSWVSGVWGTATAVTTTAARAARGAAELAVGLLRPTPSSLNGPITSLRRYSAAQVSLDDIRKVCRTFDVTINDVALAALAESYRTVLIRRGESPAPESLRTPGTGFYAVCRRSRQHRQPSLGDASLPAGRGGEPGSAAAAGPFPALSDEVHRTTSSRECVRLACQPRSVRPDNRAGAPADPTAAARCGNPRHECAGPARTSTDHGPHGHSCLAGPTDRDAAANRCRDAQLCR
jgi:hypothetical protein